MPTTSSSFLWALILTLCLAQTVHAQTIRYVSATGTNVNPATATSWATATADLQGAINSLSATGGQVWVKSGTYKPGGPANTDRNLSFALKNNVALYGNFAGSEQTLTDRPDPNPVTIRPSSTTLSGDIGTVGDAGDNSYHVFSNPSGLDASAVLDGFVITGGAGSTQGGGMYNSGGNPSLRNCAFLTNAVAGAGTSYGGAIYNQSSSPTLTNCLFQNNTASGTTGSRRVFGGAIYNDPTSSPTLTNCSFLNNTVTVTGNGDDYGGAIANYGGSPTLTSCLFQNNTVTGANSGYGGAVYNNGGNPILLKCSFLTNTAGASGGAMHNDGSNLQLTNCLFRFNMAISGGAITNAGGSPQLTGCTFENNSAGGSGTHYGGAIYNLSNATLTNCRFQSNASGNYGGAIFNSGSPRLQNCYFYNNTALSTGAAVSNNGGGAFFNDDAGSPNLTNCAFLNNGGDSGGAIYNNSTGSATIATLTNCSFQANSGLNGGGAVYNFARSSSNGSGTFNGISTTKLTNCVLFGNGGNNTISNVTNNGGTSSTPIAYSLFDNTVTGYTDGGNNLITTTSPFVSVSNIRLTATAPAINKGDLASYTAVNGPATDLDSNSRVSGGRIDMGAYEFQVTTPTRLYVKADATGANTGLSWTDALIDLQSALNYPTAQFLIDIWVAQGTCKPTSGTDRTVSFAMLPGVAIYGGFVGTETALNQRPAINPVTGTPSSSTLSGDIGTVGDPTDNSYHLIVNPSGLTTTAVLDGFVITGGNANGFYPDNNGGAIVNVSSNPTVRNCSLQSNQVYNLGGAIYNGNNSSPVLTNCSLQSNRAGNYGGAIANENGSNPQLTNCSLQSNQASYGGAIANTNASVGLTNCSLQSNQASNAGGAFFNNNSRLVLTNCSLQGNTATQGGAIINGNNSLAVLTNSVVWGNGGGNIFYNFDASSSSMATYSLFDNTTGVNTTGPGNLTTTTSPFVSVSNLKLAPNSPAINAGNNASYTTVSGPATDLAGNSRFFSNGQIDLGAYEYQGFANEILTLKDGLWNDPTVWNVGRAPLTSERVRLKHSITIPASYLALIGRLAADAGSRLVYAVGARLQFSQP